MNTAQRGHDLTDREWKKIKLYSIGEKATRGGNAKDTRQFINGVFWILRTGASWREIPPEYGHQTSSEINF